VGGAAGALAFWELAVPASVALVTAPAAAGIAYYIMVVGEDLSSHPLEEFEPGRIGATYPLVGTLTIGADAAENGVALQATASEIELPSLEIPDLASATETPALELPTVLEAGKNTPVPGIPQPRERLLPEHRSKPGRILPPQIEPPPEIGPPKWPPDNLAELLVWIMYWEAQLADTTQLQ
jgi:hypothetical protein